MATKSRINKFNNIQKRVLGIQVPGSGIRTGSSITSRSSKNTLEQSNAEDTLLNALVTNVTGTKTNVNQYSDSIDGIPSEMDYFISYVINDTIDSNSVDVPIFLSSNSIVDSKDHRNYNYVLDVAKKGKKGNFIKSELDNSEVINNINTSIKEEFDYLLNITYNRQKDFSSSKGALSTFSEYSTEDLLMEMTRFNNISMYSDIRNFLITGAYIKILIRNDESYITSVRHIPITDKTTVVVKSNIRNDERASMYISNVQRENLMKRSKYFGLFYVFGNTGIYDSDGIEMVAFNSNDVLVEFYNDNIYIPMEEILNNDFNYLAIRGRSYYDALLRSYNMLDQVETSQMIWSIQNSISKMKFVIPINGKSKARAKGALSELINSYHDEITFTDTSGKIHINGQPLKMYNKEYWLPSIEGSEPQIEEITGNDTNMNDSSLLAYFRLKFLRQTKIPLSRFEESSLNFSSSYNYLGQDDSDTATREEIRYGNFILTIRKKFTSTLLYILRNNIIKRLEKEIGYSIINDKENVLLEYLDSIIDIRFTKENGVVKSRRLKDIAAMFEKISSIVGNLEDNSTITREWLEDTFIELSEEEIFDITKGKTKIPKKGKGSKKGDKGKDEEGEPKEEPEEEKAEPKAEKDVDASDFKF